MNAVKWYLKALVQNGVALLPEPLSQSLYYQMQLRLGELRQPLFDMRFGAATQMAATFTEHHHGLAGRRILEVGTGRFVDVPMALWLMGAGEILSVDLNRLLRADLVNLSIRYLRDHWDKYRAQFAPFCDATELEQRFDRLCRAAAGGVNDDRDLARVLHLMNIVYRSPADASNLDEPDESFDYLVSFVVLQHVPPEPMAAIVKEGRRVLKQDGRQFHVCNTSDHFSFVDASVSPINFLRWSEFQWQIIAGNGFMYQNRLRADDYYNIFRDAGLAIAHLEERTDERALADLRNGSPLHQDWRGSTPERDAIIRFQVMLKRDSSR